MKKSILAILIALALGTSAFASEPDFEIEGLIPAEDLAEQLLEPQDDATDFDSGLPIEGFDDSSDLYLDGGGHQPAPGPNPGPGRYWFNCWAENRRGVRFTASDWSPRQAQREAMNRCNRFSRSCTPLGCRAQSN